MSRPGLAPDAFQPPGVGRKTRSRSWLVGSLIETAGIVLLIGEPGAGKSLIACELARCIATGEPFFDRAVNGGAVAYLAAEREGEIHLRLQSAFEGWTGETRVRITGHAKGFLANGKKPVEEIADAILALAGDIGEPVRLIVIDTLGVAMRGLDENSNRDAEIAWTLIERLRDLTGAAVCIAHHAKRSEARSRGAQAFEAGADIVLLVERGKRGGARTLRVVKANGVEEGQAIPFVIAVKRLTSDPETGDESSVAFAVAGTDPAPVPPSRSTDGERVGEIRFSGRERTAISLLMDLTQTRDKVPVHEWQQALDEALAIDNRNRWRQAWFSIRKKLEEASIISIEGTGRAQTVRLIEALESNAYAPNAFKARSAR